MYLEQLFGFLLLSRTWPVAEESLLLLQERLWLSTFNMIVHMSVEPLRIVECTLYRDKNINSVIIVPSIIWWQMKKHLKYLHRSAPTGKRIHQILQEPGCCCAGLGCSWADQDGTWAAVTRWTWAYRGSCGSKHGPPALQGYPWPEIHIHSRDKHTHLNKDRGKVIIAMKKGQMLQYVQGAWWDVTE